MSRERELMGLMREIRRHNSSGLTKDMQNRIDAALSQQAEQQGLRIVFDGPPGPEAGRFVEVENESGCSVNAGEWRERADGLWELVLHASQGGLQ